MRRTLATLMCTDAQRKRLWPSTHTLYLFLAAGLRFLVLKLLMIRVPGLSGDAERWSGVYGVRQLFFASNTHTGRADTPMRAKTEKSGTHVWNIRTGGTGELNAVTQPCGCACNTAPVWAYTDRIQEVFAATLHMHRCGEV